MTVANPDFKALWAAVCAAPADAAPKLVLADWLQENGQDPDLERGLRWCATHDKWPHRPTMARQWIWSPGPANDTSWGKSCLPFDLDLAIRGGRYRYPWAASTPRELVRRLGRALPARQRILAT